MGSLCCKPSPPPYTESDETTPLVKGFPEGWVLTVAKESWPATYVIDAISTMAATRGDLNANTVSVRFNNRSPLRTVKAFSVRDPAGDVDIALASQVACAMPLIEKLGATSREIDELERMIAEFMEKGTRPRTIEL
jgi:hypothetical protein